MDSHIILEQENENKKEDIGNKLDDFEILQTLGKGSYGFVAKVKSKINQKIYAMKMIDLELMKDPMEIEFTLNEINIIQALNSPHIVKHYANFTINKKMYIIMEYINNGDIKGFITAHQSMNKAVPEEELWEIFYQCMAGLSCIHQKNLIHRDIKPANLFLTDDKTIKIGDFGVSTVRQNSVNGTHKLKKETLMIGTPLYMSPEMFNHQEYGSKVDVYSLGCTFYEICYFSPPRMPMPVMNTNMEISTVLQDLPPKYNIGIYSPQITQLINSMIEKDQKKRLSTEQIFTIIKNNYNQKVIQNTSINCVIRCLFSFQNFVFRFLKHRQDIFQQNEKIISNSILFAYDNINNNWSEQLKLLRDVLTFNNNSFIDPGEIDPQDLIEYIIRRLHIESNKRGNSYSRLYSLDNDPNICNRQAMLTKYFANFSNFFKSYICDLFFGSFENIRMCYNCKRQRFYFENFYYIILDASQSMKYGNNPKTTNFIAESFYKEISNNINTLRYCPFCQSQQNHCENKKIFSLPINLIISIKNEGNTCINYPITIDFSFLKLEVPPGSYNLKGVIKKGVNNGRKTYVCIYEDSQNKQWVLSDGYQFQALQSPLNHNIGNPIMLFYSSNN